MDRGMGERTTHVLSSTSKQVSFHLESSPEKAPITTKSSSSSSSSMVLSGTKDNSKENKKKSSSKNDKSESQEEGKKKKKSSKNKNSRSKHSDEDDEDDDNDVGRRLLLKADKESTKVSLLKTTSSAPVSYTTMSAMVHDEQIKSDGIFSIDDMSDENHEEEAREFAQTHQNMKESHFLDDGATLSFQDYLRHTWLEPFMASTRATIGNGGVEDSDGGGDNKKSTRRKRHEEDDDNDADNAWESEGVLGVLDIGAAVEGKLAEASEALNQWTQFLLCAPTQAHPPNTERAAAQAEANAAGSRESYENATNNSASSSGGGGGGGSYFLPNISPQALAEAYLAHLRQPTTVRFKFKGSMLRLLLYCMCHNVLILT
jgi:hypothetical protein